MKASFGGGVASVRYAACLGLSPGDPPTSRPRKCNRGCAVSVLAKLRGSNAGGRGQSRQEVLLDFVYKVEPFEVQRFTETASPSVVAAMKQTVSNTVGTLPPQHFDVTIDTGADTLSSLMTTMLRTGYLFRSAQYRMELQAALARLALPTSPCSPSPPAPLPPTLATTSPSLALTPPHMPAQANASPPSPPSSPSPSPVAVASPAPTATPAAASGWAWPDAEYAPGVQSSRVGGEVLRWHPQHGVERLPAQTYIQLLEAQVAQLQDQLQRQQQQQLGQGQAHSTLTCQSPPLQGIGGGVGREGEGGAGVWGEAEEAGWGAGRVGAVDASWQDGSQMHGMGKQAEGLTMQGKAVTSKWEHCDRHSLADQQEQRGGSDSVKPCTSVSSSEAGSSSSSSSRPLPAPLNPGLTHPWAVGGPAAAGAVVAAVVSAPGQAWGSELLQYLRGVELQHLAELGTAGEDAQVAMSAFVSRLMGTVEPSQLRAMTSQFSALELSKLLFWLLVVGWTLRALEVKWEMSEEGFGY